MQYITTPREAELHAAVCMRRLLGFPDAVVTPVGPDAGIDVTSSRAIAQVKQEAAQTGRPALQRLYGARGGKTHLQMVFFSATGYTHHALEYAAEAGIALFTYDVLGNLTAKNSPATRMLNRAPDTSPKLGVSPVQPPPNPALEKLERKVAASDKRWQLTGWVGFILTTAMCLWPVAPTSMLSVAFFLSGFLGIFVLFLWWGTKSVREEDRRRVAKMRRKS